MNETRLELVNQLHGKIIEAKELSYRVRAAVESAYQEGLVEYGEVNDIRSVAARLIAAAGNMAYVKGAEDKRDKRKQNPHGASEQAAPDEGASEPG